MTAVKRTPFVADQGNLACMNKEKYRLRLSTTDWHGAIVVSDENLMHII